jgi:hypothetical protein
MQREQRFGGHDLIGLEIPEPNEMLVFDHVAGNAN